MSKLKPSLRWLAYICSLITLVFFVMSMWLPRSHIINSTAAKQSAERVLIFQLENGHLILGMYPSRYVYRGNIIGFAGFCRTRLDPSARTTSPHGRTWLSTPRFEHLTLGGSSATLFELPLIYPLLPLAVCTSVLLLRDAKKFLHSYGGQCRTCGYDLAGLPSPTCPECGADHE